MTPTPASNSQEPQSSFIPLGEDSAEPPKSSFGDLGPGDKNLLKLGLPKGTVPEAFNLDRVWNSLIDFTRPLVGNVAGLGAQAGAALTGPIGANPVSQVAAGTQGYAALDTLMQYLKTKPPNSTGEAFGEAEKQALVNEVGNRVFGGLVRGVSAVRNASMPEIYKLYPTSSQALEHYGYSKIFSTPAKVLEDMFAPSAKAAALDKSGGEGFTRALEISNIMNGRGAATNADPKQLVQYIKDTVEQGIDKQAVKGQFQKPQHYVSQDIIDGLQGGSTPFEKLDEVLDDKRRLDKVLSLGQAVGPSNLNVRKDLQAYHWMRLMNDVTDVSGPGQARINVDRLNKIWNDPQKQDVLNTLYGAQTKDNLDQFLKNVTSVQDKQMQFPGLSKIKQFGKGWSLGGGLVSGLSIPFLGGQGAAGLYLGGATMGKLLTNPNTARFLTAMAGAEPLSQPKAEVTRAIFDALHGSAIAVLDSQGQKHWGTVEKQPGGGYKLEQIRGNSEGQ